MKPNILLWKNKCWESRGSNVGDLAIIAATIASLKTSIPEIEITLLSDDPEYTSALYGIRSQRIGVASILRALRNTDMILIGGGTVFTDSSSITIIPINTILPLMGALFRKPVATWGIGSSRKSPLGRLMVRLLMPHIKVASVRDQETGKDLAAIFPPAASHIHVTEDAAFAFQVDAVEKQRKNRIVIAPRRIFHYKRSILPFYLRKKFGLLPGGYFAKMEAFKDLLARLADYVVERHDADISLLPMYSAIGGNTGMSGYLKSKFSSRDDVICRDILARMRHKARAAVFVSDSPGRIINHIAGSRAVVGVPLHSLILAHLTGTPFLGLSYQEKVSRFMRRSGMERFMIHLEEMSCPLDLEEFTGKLDALLGDERGLGEHIARTNSDIQKVVDLPARMIAEFLTSRSRVGRAARGNPVS